MTSTEAGAPSAATVETLLVVDDEVLIRLAISDYLRECGFKVIEAASAEEAIVVLEQSGKTIDLVLSDVEMPGSMDGFALSAWIRTHQPGLPVVMAGSPSRAASAAAELCETGPQLSKPYDTQLLIDHIRRLLGTRKASPAATFPDASQSGITPLL
jgi:DNA-binding NtrC family response regulator